MKLNAIVAFDMALADGPHDLPAVLMVEMMWRVVRQIVEHVGVAVDAEAATEFKDENLRIDIDPKRAWAERNLREAPIDVMKATRRQLLRVPGIGPIGADAILRARRLGVLTELAHLRKLNIHAPEQAAPYILLAGRRPATQLRLF